MMGVSTGEGYLNSLKKKDCFGCQACKQVCPKNAVDIVKDKEGFFYPSINKELCVHCGLCHKSCPAENKSLFNPCILAYGGYNVNQSVRKDSSSGGVFSLIAEKCIDDGYVVFGAVSEKLYVFHDYAIKKDDLWKFRKSKYIQSDIKNVYKKVKEFLVCGRNVLFSGTPCQIAGLKSFLLCYNSIKMDNLLTVDVACQGVPSPLFVEKHTRYLEKKYNAELVDFFYRNKTYRREKGDKWDYRVEKIVLKKRKKNIFIYTKGAVNPFWSIWLKNLMSRPSCYECPFVGTDRVSDITLGDLWGVKSMCPELYNENRGTSFVLCNTEKGKNLFAVLKDEFCGKEIDLVELSRHESRLRKTKLEPHPDRDVFMAELASEKSYKDLISKWNKKTSFFVKVKRFFYKIKFFIKKLVIKEKEYDLR